MKKNKTILLVGEFSKERSFLFGGKPLERVFRILGSEETGFLYFARDEKGREIQNQNPLWHDEVAQFRRTTPKAGEERFSRWTHEVVEILRFEGCGYYRVKSLEGLTFEVHEEGLISR